MILGSYFCFAERILLFVTGAVFSKFVSSLVHGDWRVRVVISAYLGKIRFQSCRHSHNSLLSMHPQGGLYPSGSRVTTLGQHSLD